MYKLIKRIKVNDYFCKSVEIYKNEENIYKSIMNIETYCYILPVAVQSLFFDGSIMYDYVFNSDLLHNTLFIDDYNRIFKDYMQYRFHAVEFDLIQTKVQNFIKNYNKKVA